MREASEDSDVHVLVLIDGLAQSEIALVSDCATKAEIGREFVDKARACLRARGMLDGG
jgi:hypothetical protein